MKLSHWSTLGFGVLLIALLTPLAQFLTILTVNSSIETATPVGWAVGFVVSFVLCGLVLHRIAKVRGFSHQQLALLYIMLTIAVPLMNLGLVRQVYLASVSVVREYVYEGTSTYRTAYSALTDDWFPLIPTTEGLAWSKADQLLKAMEDRVRLNREQAAQRIAFDLLGTWQSSEDLRPDAVEIDALTAAAADLGLAGLADLLQEDNRALFTDLGVWSVLTRMQAQREAESERALTLLPELLAPFQDWEASLLPSNFGVATLSDQRRFRRALELLDVDQRAVLEARVAALEAAEADIRRAVGALSQADRNTILATLQARYLGELASLDDAALAFERESHVFRLSRDERRRIYRQDGTQGPNQNLWAFQNSFWEDVGEQQQKAQQSFWANLGTVWERLPWQIWWRPMLMWGTLLTVLFLFVLSLAEVLRRRWVDRENLTFPLVEVADGIIRHDYELETASDARAPAKRETLFSRFFLIGIAVGFMLLFVEALYHYQFISIAPRLFFDFKEQIFVPVGGPLREIAPTVFVLSPIIIGIVFLLSLEISLSIWVSFLLVTIFSWTLKLGFPEIKDSVYTGFDGGKNYPFFMEQMFGACVCFALYLIWKFFSQGGAQQAPQSEGAARQSFAPAWMGVHGLWLFPLVALGLLWHLGIENIPLLLIFFSFILVQMIVAARMRAETGLPTTHVQYEMSKMPIVLGLTEMTGGKVYTAFLNVVFLPATLLFRALPACLENLELARRLRLSYRSVLLATLAAFFTALTVGGLSFLLFSYYWGGDFHAQATFPVQNIGSTALATYPLWVAHFLGEAGLEVHGQVNVLRLSVMAVGFGATGLLILLRQRFLGFPLHPIGYLVILFSIYFNWCTPYVTVEGLSHESSLLWGSALVAWGTKKLILKYGGMGTYKRTKPLFVGLVVGSVLCVFFWNALDLGASLLAREAEEVGPFLRPFTETVPYMPALY